MSGGEPDQAYDGIVTTRNHFSAPGKLNPFGGVRLTDGHTAEDFDTEGTVPGYTEGRAPRALAVFVHGFNNSPREAREIFEAATTAMRDNGFQQPVVGYSWDSLGDLRWSQAVDVAQRNGQKLANFLFEYKRENPGTPIRLIGHSLGTQVVFWALQALRNGALTEMAHRQWGDTIDTVTLLGSAVDRRAPQLDGQMYTHLGRWYSQQSRDPLGSVLADTVDRFHNFYSGNDGVLKKYFSAGERFQVSALGRNGAKRPDATPFNYYEHDVTKTVTDHSDYYRPEKGCMDDVVHSWRYEPHRFRLNNANSNLPLSLAQDGGDNIVQADPVAGQGLAVEDRQYWRLNRLQNGEFLLASVETNDAASVANASTDNGANVLQADWGDVDNPQQRWYVDHVGDGRYTVKNVNSGKVLDVTGASTESGTNVQQYGYGGNKNQQWRFVRYLNQHRIENVNSGKVLDVQGRSTDEGANVHQWNWLGRRNQRWKFQYLGDEEYAIVNVHSNMVLDVKGDSTEDGANIHQWNWHGGDNQRWYVRDVGNGECKIVNVNSGKVIDVDGGGRKKGVNIQQWSWHDGDNQRFRIQSA